MRILVLGDCHFPWAHKKAVAWAIKLAHKLKPTHIVQVGDVMDMFSWSKFPKVVKVPPEKELLLARKGAEGLWKALPDCTKIQLLGNHDVRPLRKALAVAPELAPLVGRSLHDLFTFPGVKTIYDDKEEFILGGIMFQHGHRSKLGDHARYNQRKTVCGHSHTGGVVYLRNLKGVFWELNAGFLGDVSSPAFGYHAQKRMHTTTLGVGWIDDLGPRFIPYD